MRSQWVNLPLLYYFDDCWRPMVYLDAVEMRQIIDFRLSFMAILVLCLRLFLPLRGP
jgi:hypothetical protein